MSNNYVTWRDLQPGDFFYDDRARWYGLKLSKHRYFNFLALRMAGVCSDFFDIPIFTKVHCEFIKEGKNERPQGKWILCEDNNFSRCSICGDILLNEECNNYCPKCGAYMRSDDDGEK